jgi:hypothetical protein
MKRFITFFLCLALAVSQAAFGMNKAQAKPTKAQTELTLAAKLKAKLVQLKNSTKANAKYIAIGAGVVAVVVGTVIVGYILSRKNNVHAAPASSTNSENLNSENVSPESTFVSAQDIQPSNAQIRSGEVIPETQNPPVAQQPLSTGRKLLDFEPKSTSLNVDAQNSDSHYSDDKAVQNFKNTMDTLKNDPSILERDSSFRDNLIKTINDLPSSMQKKLENYFTNCMYPDASMTLLEQGQYCIGEAIGALYIELSGMPQL